MFAEGSFLRSLDLVAPTKEAVTLNAMSCGIAQAVNAYQARSVSAIDYRLIIQSMVFTALVTVPNHVFQSTLEYFFPTRTLPREEAVQAAGKEGRQRPEVLRTHGQLNIRNTAIKFLLDQTLAATTNTVLFIAVFGMMRGQTLEGVEDALRNDFGPMLLAGYRFWPVVCLVNLVLVPLEYRPTVGSVAGLAWGVAVNMWWT